MILALSLLAGALGWTFAEYALHHWVGHLTRGRTDFSREHLHHHRVEDYFTPTPKKVAVAASVLVPLTAALAWLVGAIGVAFAIGFATMYVAYEVLHRTLHTHPPRTAYGRWARRHHLHHHHRDARSNHGVTTPIWDHVFGTLQPSPRVRVPRQRAPAWMVDAEGELLARWAGEYELIGPRRRRAEAVADHTSAR